MWVNKLGVKLGPINQTVTTEWSMEPRRARLTEVMKNKVEGGTRMRPLGSFFRLFPVLPLGVTKNNP